MTSRIVVQAGPLSEMIMGEFCCSVDPITETGDCLVAVWSPESVSKKP